MPIPVTFPSADVSAAFSELDKQYPTSVDQEKNRADTKMFEAASGR
jgi:hypothetical protein